MGILYFCLMFFGISFVLGIIDAIVFFNMDDETFDRKYNAVGGTVPPIYRRMQGFPDPPSRSRNTPRTRQTNNREPSNPYKINGIKKYKEFDLEGAIEDFKKGLEIQPQDISLHFNLACAYSLTEQVDKAYAHLDRAVAFYRNTLGCEVRMDAVLGGEMRVSSILGSLRGDHKDPFESGGEHAP